MPKPLLRHGIPLGDKESQGRAKIEKCLYASHFNIFFHIFIERIAGFDSFLQANQ
jgi:hypothetical protein